MTIEIPVYSHDQRLLQNLHMIQDLKNFEILRSRVFPRLSVTTRRVEFWVIVALRSSMYPLDTILRTSSASFADVIRFVVF